MFNINLNTLIKNYIILNKMYELSDDASEIHNTKWLMWLKVCTIDFFKFLSTSNILHYY